MSRRSKGAIICTVFATLTVCTPCHAQGLDKGLVPDIHRTAVFSPRNDVAALERANSVESGDFDGDGDLDLAASTLTPGVLNWYENDGTGNGWVPHAVASESGSIFQVHVDDVDLDTDLDIVAAIPSGKIAWYENNGSGGGWTEHVVGTGLTQTWSVFAADLDGDDDRDLAATASGVGLVVWFENTNSSGTAWTSHILTTGFFGGRTIYGADFDGDNDVDLVAGSHTGDQIFWWENDGFGGFTQHVLEAFIDGPRWMSAADVDGDSDQDILGAMGEGNAIYWWENVNGDASSWQRNTVDGAILQPYVVKAADFDLDGDLDLMGAGIGDDVVKWYENTAGDGSAWTATIVEIGFDHAYNGDPGDFDNDGDMDIAAVARFDGLVSWWENRGGHFALATTDTAPAAIGQGVQNDLLRITASHQGRAGDTDLELASFELELSNAFGQPLSISTANALIENLHVYLDDGDGVFEQGEDAAVTTIANLSVIGGVLTVPFTHGDPNVRIAFGAPKTYFVVPEIAVDAPEIGFMVTHLTESTGTAVNVDTETPLTLEFAPNVSASTVVQPPPLLISAVNADAESILVVFDSVMGASALDPSNYTVSGPGAAGVAAQPDDVVQTSPAGFLLVWNAGAFTLGADVTVDVNGVQDQDGNPVGGSGEFTFTVGPGLPLSNQAVIAAILAAVGSLILYRRRSRLRIGWR